MHTITLDIDSILFWSSALGIFATAVVWICKGMGPVFRPFTKLRSDVEKLKVHKTSCDEKFDNDQRRLDKQDALILQILADNKQQMKALVLLLKHAETGNCTGEVAEGRKEFEEYLIDRD